VNIPQSDWIYDIETYLDLFCIDLTHAATRTRYIYEVSDRVDQSAALLSHLGWLRDNGARMFGFNNEHFDWPVLQFLMQAGSFTAYDAHRKGTEIITSQDRWAHVIWPSDRFVTQGDLFKIHHFDNRARSTSLKKLEINMRSGSVVDLPYPPDQPTTSAQKDEIVTYMAHDVSETFRFYVASLPAIHFRDELAQKYPDMGDILNMNDTKIGKKFFERELERNGTPCYTRDSGRRQPRQTKREQIRIDDIISTRVIFQHPEFQRIELWLREQVLTRQMIDDSLSETVDTKGVFKDVSATIDGFTFHFGTGGIHGAVENSVWRSDSTRQVQGRDVASYYPNLAISNRFYPDHLSETFCDVYKQVYDMRRSYPKGTPENAMLKLALNGVYGDSNNKYSPFYDPQYTMAITVNGQLLLCMLVEQLMRTPTLQMIQVNTDGLEYIVDREWLPHVDAVCEWWETLTRLELETENYSAFFQRDVNSYIAVLE
jgi:hypothetical protein